MNNIDLLGDEHSFTSFYNFLNDLEQYQPQEKHHDKLVIDQI